MTLRTALLCLVLLPTLASAQDNGPWTLEKCIQHAWDNNIQVRQAWLQSESNNLDKTQALMGMLPSLNASTGYGANFGRTIDPGTNQFVTETVHSNQFNLMSNVTLFNGFVLYNTFRQSQLSVLVAKYDLDAAKNDLALNIASAFMQVMFNEELMAISANQVKITEGQIDRSEKLVAGGTMAEGSLFETRAQLANDRLQLVNADNRLRASLLTLRQMLNLKADVPFSIARPSIDVPIDMVTAQTVDAIYDAAVQKWPQIKAREARVQVADKGVSIAFGSLMPSLTANASVSSLYSSSYKNYSVDSVTFQPIATEIPYGNQLDQNLSERIGLSLSIPIFNGLQARTGWKKSRLGRENAELQLRDTQNQLYTSVQQAYNDALASYRQLDASQESLAATEKAFEYAQQRFNVGMMNPYDFNTTKNNLARVRSDVLRAKYDYIFRTKVLDFYMGKGIAF